MTTLKQIIHIMEVVAPARLAEHWDNVGLQVGDPDWPVKRIRLALDAAPQVIQAACDAQIDLLITHHPLIFKPLSQINCATSSGNIIQSCIQHRLGLFCAHTNLDCVQGGVNDALAGLLELQDVQILRPHSESAVKIVVYVPREHEAQLLEALFETPAGQIGQYTCCSFRQPGTGSFLPQSGSTPYLGKIGLVNHVPEIRIEAVALKEDIPAIIAHLRRSHPYETMAYDVYPLQSALPSHGLGRIGRLKVSQSPGGLAEVLKSRLGLKYVRIAGQREKMVEEVAVCSGSGHGLVADFLKSNAMLYVSGDLGYHDAQAIIAAGKCLIDLGHFASEHLVLEHLRKRLQHVLVDSGSDVTVDICSHEQDPFELV